MGIKRFQKLAREIARTSGAKEPTIIPGSAGPSVCAVDANCMVYWAYASFLKSKDVIEDGGRKVTHLDTPAVSRRIVELFLTCLRNLVGTLEPEVLIIALDGVPPTAKVIDQRRRRVDASENDLYSPDGALRYTTTWIAPNSPLMELLDGAMRMNPVQGSVATLYSGPGLNGEGEHKLYPMLQALCRHGLAAIPGDPGRNTWRAKTIYVIGNDNDLYLLSTIFLATFEKDPPRVLLYNDFGTRRQIATAHAASADGAVDDGILDLSDPAQLQVFEIQQLLGGITGDGAFSGCGTGRMQKIMHFIHVASLLGNDFLPAVTLGDDENTDPILLLKLICKAGQESAPWIPAPEVPLPVETEDEELPYVAEIVSDRAGLMRYFQRLQDLLSQNARKLLPSYDMDADQIALHALSAANGVSPEKSNHIAFAAACEYVRIMDNVLSYYLASTAVVPNIATARFVLTMPHEYYAYGFPLPSAAYLTAAAQYLAAIQNKDDGGKSYKEKTHAAVLTFSLSGVSHSERPTPVGFIEMGFHSALLFPGRTREFASSVYPSASILATQDHFRALFPMRSDPRTNTNILPYTIFDMIRQRYGQMTPAFQRAKLLTSLVFLLDGAAPAPRRTGHYVDDSLAIQSA
jgi:hypothetical protein